MAKLTGTDHGDAASALLSFYHEQAKSLERSGHYFMAAIALAFGVETAILAYLLVELERITAASLTFHRALAFMTSSKQPMRLMSCVRPSMFHHTSGRMANIRSTSRKKPQTRCGSFAI